MINYGKIRSTIAPEPLEIDECTVYINSDIQTAECEYEGNTYIEYEFNQIRYDKNEYIKLMSETNNRLEQAITDTQLALCEIYESEEIDNG